VTIDNLIRKTIPTPCKLICGKPHVMSITKTGEYKGCVFDLTQFEFI